MLLHKMEMKRLNRGFKSLAEAVILQSLEDLCNPQHRKESRDFFEGDGFKVFAEIADLHTLKKYKIIHLTGGRKYGRAISAQQT